jgi:hypothetical protein
MHLCICKNKKSSTNRLTARTNSRRRAVLTIPELLLIAHIVKKQQANLFARIGIDGKIYLQWRDWGACPPQDVEASNAYAARCYLTVFAGRLFRGDMQQRDLDVCLHFT